MDLYNNIQSVLSRKNVDLAVGDMYDYMAMWREWYAGNVKDFHHYKIKLANGTTTEADRLTMNMAKKLCEDMAKLLWTEKTQIKLGSLKATKKLWEVLDNKINSFTINFPIFIEKVLAIGNGALIEYKDNGITTIDYVLGDSIIPYKYTNSYIYGLITISRFSEAVSPEEQKEEVNYYTHITYHEYDIQNSLYKKKNELYLSKVENELGKEVDFSTKFPNVVAYEEITTDVPFFQVLRPNIANNLDTSSPLGISIFANSVDRFKAIDLKYDSFSNEFELGRKRILVDNSTLKAKSIPNEDGTVSHVQYFDANDKVYVAIEGMEKQPAKEIDFNIRSGEHIDSIEKELQWLGQNVGLGSNFYQTGNLGNKTATEVMSELSEAFRTREHHLDVVKDVVYDLVKAICNIEGIKATDIVITPDDSIIEDINTRRTIKQLEVQQGLESKKGYLMEINGLTEEQALEKLEEINEEKMTTQEIFGFPTEENPNAAEEKQDRIEEAEEGNKKSDKKKEENEDKEEKEDEEKEE